MQWFLVSSQSYATIASNYRTFSSSPIPITTCIHAKLLQSCPTLCDPMDCSPPGPSVHEILQALEWVDLPSSGESSQPGIKPVSPAILALQVDSLPLSHWGSPYPLTATLNFPHLLPPQLTTPKRQKSSCPYGFAYF